MKRGFVIGGSVLVGLIILIVVVLWFVYSSLDSLVKAAVEKYGSEITQAKVSLGGAQISATSGQASLRGLVVGNPKGFQTESSFRLGEIRMTLDVGTVTKNPVVIKEIVVTEPQITYEIGPRGTNIDAIRRNVDSYTGKGKGEKTGSSSKESGGEGRKLIIEHLYIRNGKVSVSAAGLQGKQVSGPLPTIHLTDIGKQKGGATPGEFAERVLTAVGQGVGKAVASPDMKSVVEAAKGQATGAGQAVQDAVKGVGESVKGLFGN